jgi:chromosome segregation ATPase
MKLQIGLNKPKAGLYELTKNISETMKILESFKSANDVYNSGEHLKEVIKSYRDLKKEYTTRLKSGKDVSETIRSIKKFKSRINHAYVKKHIDTNYLAKRLKKSLMAHDTMSNEITKLKSIERDYESNVSMLEDKIKELTQQIAQLTELSNTPIATTDADSVYKSLEKQHLKLQKKHDKLVGDLKNHREQIAELKAQIMQKDNMLKDIEYEISHRDVSIDKYLKDLEELQKYVSDVELRNNTLELENSNLQKLNTRLSIKDTECKNVKDMISNTQHELDKKTAQYGTLQQRYQELINKNNILTKDSERQINVLTENLEKLKKNITELELSKELLKENLETAIQERDTLNKEMQEMLTENSSMKSTVDMLSETTDSQDATIERLSKQLEQCKITNMKYTRWLNENKIDSETGKGPLSFLKYFTQYNA